MPRPNLHIRGTEGEESHVDGIDQIFPKLKKEIPSTDTRNTQNDKQTGPRQKLPRVYQQKC